MTCPQQRQNHRVQQHNGEITDPDGDERDADDQGQGKPRWSGLAAKEYGDCHKQGEQKQGNAIGEDIAFKKQLQGLDCAQKT